MAKTIHQLKILPEYFELKLAGKKFWEFRKNDRLFKIGDVVQLREWTGTEYTGRSMRIEIVWLFPVFDNHIIFSEKIIGTFLLYNSQPEANQCTQ